MRPSGRKNNEMRQVVFIPDFTKYAEGSVLACFGDTKVLCTASIEERIPGFMRGQNRGWITAEYSMLPRATHTRGAREAAKGRQTGRTQEIQRLIGRSLRAVVDLERLGERTITLDCDVIQADGGTRTTAISGAFIAMYQAIQRLINAGILKESPIRSHVAAVSVGIFNGQAVLDLDYAEDSQAQTDMNVVMDEYGRFIELQATAEMTAFTTDQLQQLLLHAQNGITEIIAKQRELY